jgi:hypothetical protein
MEYNKKWYRKNAFNWQSLSLINSENVKDPQILASAFNTFFLTVAGNLNLHQGGREYALSLLKDALPERFPGIKIIQTTESEIKKYNTLP